MPQCVNLVFSNNYMITCVICIIFACVASPSFFSFVFSPKKLFYCGYMTHINWS
uniref:Uncharacterized protein n=1 Tax=Rhizophora mucronata TaxID=61149 RepID=A0A2P2PVW7_RHIMU